jgi:hypothetical protein
VDRRAIDKKELWEEAVCTECQEVIHRGDPRCVVFFAELGIGPGHPAYTKEKETEEAVHDRGELREYGPDWRFSTALAFHVPCAGNKPQIELPNYWFWWREQGAANDPGPSVRAIAVSQLKIRVGDIAGDYRFVASGGKDDKGMPSPALTEAQDRLLSSDPQPAKMTEEDYWDDMPRFLESAAGKKLPPRMRTAAKLRSERKGQNDIARELGVDQSTVSRELRYAKSALYAWRQGFL